MKKLFGLIVCAFAVALFAQDMDTVDVAALPDSTETIATQEEVAKPEAVEVQVAQIEEVKDTVKPAPKNTETAITPSVLEKLALEYFLMKQSNDLEKNQKKEKEPKTGLFMLSFRGAGRTGESGGHILQIIELGGYTETKNFMISGELHGGNRIGGLTANFGIVIPVVKGMFSITPGFSGGFLLSANKAYADNDYYYDSDRYRGQKEVFDFAYSGAFVKILLGKKDGKIFFDITNKVMMTKSDIDYNYYYSYYDDDEKFGASYIGSIGFTLLL